MLGWRLTAALAAVAARAQVRGGSDGDAGLALRAKALVRRGQAGVGCEHLEAAAEDFAAAVALLEPTMFADLQRTAREHLRCAPC
jgi:hypothetical protein